MNDLAKSVIRLVRLHQQRHRTSPETAELERLRRELACVPAAKAINAALKHPVDLRDALLGQGRVTF